MDPCEGCLFALRAAACHQFGVFVMFDDDDDDDDDDNICLGLFGVMNIIIQKTNSNISSCTRKN